MYKLTKSDYENIKAQGKRMYKLMGIDNKSRAHQIYLGFSFADMMHMMHINSDSDMTSFMVYTYSPDGWYTTQFIGAESKAVEIETI